MRHESSWEIIMKDAYKHAYDRWNAYYYDALAGGSMRVHMQLDKIRYDTASVKGAYWKLCNYTKDHLIRDLFPQNQEKAMDTSEEMRDLLQIYDGAHKQLKEDQEHALNVLVRYMRQFVELYDKCYQTKNKLDTLNRKMLAEEHEK